MSTLVFQLGESNELEVDLAADVVILGRASDNDIVIENAWISWHHARFDRTGNSYRVVDLHSHNGILLNNTRISEATLKSGDVLRFGQLRAVFRDRGSGPTPPSAGPSPARAPATVPLVAGAPQPVATRPPRPLPTPPVSVPPPRPKPAPESGPGSPGSPPHAGAIASPTTAPGEAVQSPPGPAPVVTAVAEAAAPTGETATQASSENAHQFARSLIKRIDLLDDLAANVAGGDARLASQLSPLRTSFVELLRELSVEPFSVEVGKALDVATRKRIHIVEPATEPDGATEIAEVFRCGYLWRNGDGTAPLILRKAEVRTRKVGSS